jgi:hypothetical protein
MKFPSSVELSNEVKLQFPYLSILCDLRFKYNMPVLVLISGWIEYFSQL